MPTFPVLTMDRQSVGEVTLSERVFGGRVNEHLLWEAVRQRQTSRRAGTVKTKTRGEVTGAGRKLWRQKGTGRARIASIRSPLWRHGGTVHGPRPKDYDYMMPEKAHHGAMRSALAQKAHDGNLLVLSELELEAARTAVVNRLLGQLGIEGTGLFVTAERDAALDAAVRNHPRAAARSAATITPFDVIRHQKLIVTQEAAKKLEEVYGR